MRLITAQLTIIDLFMTFRTDTTDIGQLNYNKNSFLILLGQRNKYISEITSTGKYKKYH